MSKTKLELTWIGKDKQPRLEPRILLEDATKSHGAKDSENLLIHGDNLLALKALEQDYAGKVKCIYIDPPYNTGSAFEHYDDGIEHSIWLSLIRDRLVVLRNLLREDGSIWISIDDTECHYLKVMCDEVFGRRNFETSFIWKKVDSPNDNKVAITPDHEYIFCYAKNIETCQFRQKIDHSILDAYKQPDEFSDRPYRDRLLKKNGKNSLRKDRPSMFFPIPTPDGGEVLPIHDDGREARWALGKESVFDYIQQNLLVWKKREKDGESAWVPYTREYAPNEPTRPWPTIWDDVHTSRQAKAHLKDVFGAEVEFDTPKPENLISQIFSITTNPGDLVLDSFLGSGTTAAVAHKMGRRWIGIELGDHCTTHCLPRLKKVVDGQDPGGITDAVSWKGGGGFKFYELAPSLLNKDEFGNFVISSEYNATMLAAAMAKHEGFRFSPDATVYWKQGKSTERDYIFTTTNMLTVQEVERIAGDMPSGETLLICCKAYQDGVPRVSPFITVKKIPHMLLGRCEFDKNDYSLHIVPAPKDDDAEVDAPTEDETAGNAGTDQVADSSPKKKSRKGKAKQGPDLFGEEE